MASHAGARTEDTLAELRIETDSLGPVELPAYKL